jgi:glucose-6-phosphate isomerase
MIKIVTKENSSVTIEQVTSAIDMLVNVRNQGYLSLHSQETLWKSSMELAKSFRKKFSHLVLCGIGGSSLGFESFQHLFHFDQVIILDNVETSVIMHRLKGLSLDQLGWVFISKSGGTIETLSTLDWMIEYYESNQISWTNRIAVITESKSSSLHSFAIEHQLPRLDVPLNVGGRYSVFSPVGLFPLFFCGVSEAAIRQGIEAALNNKKFVADFVSAVLKSFERNEWITSFWLYSSKCPGLGRWISQLWAESLAKKLNRDGNQGLRVSTPLWMIGASDQHSLLQQWMDGARDKFVVFIKFNLPIETLSESNKISHPRFVETQSMKNKSLDQLLRVEADATQAALAKQGVNTIEICLSTDSIQDVAELKMLLMMSVGVLGEMLNLNAFDQPGVELGKQMAKQLLENLKSS